jgi:protein involved in polysaccharide export with SLBB domain
MQITNGFLSKLQILIAPAAVRVIDMNAFIKYMLVLWLIGMGITHSLPADPSFSTEQPYRIRYGDRFIFSMYGEPGTNVELSVGPDGKLHYLFSISLLAIGKSIPDIREEFTQALQKYFKHPLLNIVPIRFSPQFYTIIGEVMNPGIKIALPNATVMSALCEAGGFTTRLFRNQTVEQVDLDRSFLARNGNYIQIDFEDLLQKGNMEWDIPLQEGDYLYFASLGLNKVYVLGEVQRSVVVDYLGGITLMQALSEAGGVTLRASSRLLVIRGSLAYPRWFYIDSNLIFKGKSCDFELKPKDIVYVPPMQFQTLKETLQAGIASFASIVANIGGTNSFLEITPAAKGANIVSPVPVVGSIPAPAPAPAVAAPN